MQTPRILSIHLISTAAAAIAAIAATAAIATFAATAALALFYGAYFSLPNYPRHLNKIVVKRGDDSLLFWKLADFGPKPEAEAAVAAAEAAAKAAAESF